MEQSGPSMVIAPSHGPEIGSGRDNDRVGKLQKLKGLTLDRLTVLSRDTEHCPSDSDTDQEACSSPTGKKKPQLQLNMKPLRFLLSRMGPASPKSPTGGKGDGPTCGECQMQVQKKKEVVCRGCNQYFCERHCTHPMWFSPIGRPNPDGVQYNVCKSCHAIYSNKIKPNAPVDPKTAEKMTVSAIVHAAKAVESQRRRSSLNTQLGPRQQVHDLAPKGLNNSEHAVPREGPTTTIDSPATVRRRISNHIENRPTVEQVVKKGILKSASAKDMETRKSDLERKLSDRPDISVLVERRILWCNMVTVCETYGSDGYDRVSEKPWTKLTPKDKVEIKKELNDFKSYEMAVHEESRHYTRFHK
eukprot:comp22990_c0_seq1/m.36599 comp22990_c0_seq1/g.36599  ORF comp22990_c0_seq1/g.36599 comp22990_c0_seq1/m.36599 type:complete len:359 (-) comp22990_c0_seq1:652-1728(-)